MGEKESIQLAILETEEKRLLYEIGKEASLVLSVITMVITFLFHSPEIFTLSISSLVFFWWASGKEYTLLGVLDYLMVESERGEE